MWFKTLFQFKFFYFTARNLSFQLNLIQVPKIHDYQLFFRSIFYTFLRLKYRSGIKDENCTALTIVFETFIDKVK